MAENDSEPLLGAHVSIAGGVEKAVARGVEIGCNAIQIFTGNASRWKVKALTRDVVQKFRRDYEQSSIRYVAAHNSYLINLASPDEVLRSKSIAAFIEEMERCHALGIADLVMHPGAHMGRGVESGLYTLAESLRVIVQQAPADVRILLENTAGQGTCLGSTFEELAEIIRLVPEGGFAVCLDTCHAFAAGYDLGSSGGYSAVIERFDTLIGTESIALFHANDSKNPLGSRVDRHEHVGQGCIGSAGFEMLMKDRRFSGVAKIIETPGGENHCHDLDNLALLRRFESSEKGDS